MGMLRLILALSVVMSHGLTTLAGIQLIDAAGAVWVFFTISGFLITIALNRKYSVSGSLIHFYWNRLIRIFPTYWTWLVVTVLAYTALPSAWFVYQKISIGGSDQPLGFWVDWIGKANPWVAVVAVFANVTGLFTDAFLNLGFDQQSGTLVINKDHTAPIWAMGFIFIGQFWSIGVELIFYALAPLIVRSLPRITIVFILSLTGFASSWWTQVTEFLSLPVMQAMKFPEFVWMFMLGAALAKFYLRWLDRDSITAAGAVVALMFVAVLFSPHLFPTPRFPGWLYVALVALVLPAFHFTRRNGVDGFLGDLSYPIYVAHFQLVQLFGTAFSANGLLFAVAAIAVSCMLVVFVERPANRWKFQSRDTLSQPGSSMFSTNV